MVQVARSMSIRYLHRTEWLAIHVERTNHARQKLANERGIRTSRFPSDQNHVKEFPGS